MGVSFRNSIMMTAALTSRAMEISDCLRPPLPVRGILDPHNWAGISSAMIGDPTAPPKADIGLL
jgi:hypothetical protein